LRKFEYSKALDQVLKPYVMRKHPEYTYSVLRELKRRNGLKTAIGGRDEKNLVPLLQYLLRNLADSKFSNFLIEVIDLTLGKNKMLKN
jgi:U3 small nucleolar RNA-associated protein 15